MLDQTTYNKAYGQIMNVISEIGYNGPGGCFSVPDPAMMAALLLALRDVTKELELEIKMTGVNNL